MSYDIYLKHPETGEVAQPSIPSLHYGGTHKEGVEFEAVLNVTFNYTPLFNFYDRLDGKTGEETFVDLKVRVMELGTHPDEDYWKCTEGNVGRACALLMCWADEFPDYVWTVHK